MSSSVGGGGGGVGKKSGLGGGATTVPSSAAAATPVLGERESADGRSSTAPLDGGGRGAGRGGRSGGSGGGGGGGGSGGSVSSGLTHFDTEMEANRLAYVLHLQVCFFVQIIFRRFFLSSSPLFTAVFVYLFVSLRSLFVGCEKNVLM